jgi:hypothetical protein
MASAEHLGEPFAQAITDKLLTRLSSPEQSARARYLAYSSWGWSFSEIELMQ